MQTSEQGMRDMQQRAFAQRNSQYLLIKSPPASGKSRAMMFLALDKRQHQGLKKVIVSVPERSIGASFSNLKLTEHGFFSDWQISPQYNLCTPGSDQNKRQIFIGFLEDESADILLCTHSTLRNAYENLGSQSFCHSLQGCLLGIDEFHHVSVSDESRLGEVIRSLMTEPSIHIVAMTGSYFRGDREPILLPEDEAKFDQLTYTYYEQLSGYTHLKSLGIDYHFYTGEYLSAIGDVLDPNKKTLIHIPSVNAGESTKQKYEEVNRIIDVLGVVEYQDPDTKVLYVKQKSGDTLKVADLVNDHREDRDKIMTYLRGHGVTPNIDIIIALGMAKEGFDWPACEHALTVGYRSSLTEVIQIIGRTTRDHPGKSHAQYTNLIAEPIYEDESEVKDGVNNMLKAIAASLLMEQVLTPNYKFKRRRSRDQDNEADNVLNDESHDSSSQGQPEIRIHGFREPTSDRVREITKSNMAELNAHILQHSEATHVFAGGHIDPEIINKNFLPRYIAEKYPDLTAGEIEEVRHEFLAQAVLKKAKQTKQGGKSFLQMSSKFINVEELSMDLIDRVNPFGDSFAVLSKKVNAKLLSAIRDTISVSRIKMTVAEAVSLYSQISKFIAAKNRKPSMDSKDLKERRLGEALLFLIQLKRQKKQDEQLSDKTN
ncbi:MAG: helicase-related protein [Proteobacteria bacterium]|nr:helicase-related protein [Pseudomonadota bacterium]